MKKFNTVSIYSSILLLLTIGCGYVIKQLTFFAKSSWDKLLENDPLPGATEWLISHPTHGSMLFGIIFLALMILGMTNEKIKNISLHVMIITSISKLCYLMWVGVCLALPTISVYNQM